MTSAALASWRESATPNGEAPPQYPSDLLALSIGAFLPPSGKISRLHAELTATAGAELDLVPAASLHFTMLAVTRQIFPNRDALGPLAAIVSQTINGILTSENVTWRETRVLPMKNALVLAGYPDDAGVKLRDRLARALLQSPAGSAVQERYAGFPIPPMIWHATLARSRTAPRLPEAAQAVFHRWRHESLGDFQLGPFKLHAASFDWSTAVPF